jgi:hypothetical protein
MTCSLAARATRSASSKCGSRVRICQTTRHNRERRGRSDQAGFDDPDAHGRSSHRPNTNGGAVGYDTVMFGFFRRQDPRFKEEGNALLARVRTNANGEVIQIRLSKTSEMSAVAGGYFVRKSLVGPKSFDSAVLEVTTNRGHKVTAATVDGGELIPVAEWG